MDYSTIGRERIREVADPPNPLPYEPWGDFPLFFTAEYPVREFVSEVGFWTHVFGAEFLSVSDDYAIVKNTDGSTFSFRQHNTDTASSAHRLQWFTDGLDAVLHALDERGAAYEIIRNSNNQRFARLITPAGMTVEIWSGAEKTQNEPPR